jgi:hypothetical protein
MTWPAHIEQWRKFAIWECRDIPPDLVLAIIQHESQGIAGLLSGKNTMEAEIERTDGSRIGVNRAMGLMQVIPPNVADWNAKSVEKAFYEDMVGSDERASRMQIRLGCWIYASAVRTLHAYDPVAFPGYNPGTANNNQLKLALVVYAIGFRNLKPKLDRLKTAGLELDTDNLIKLFPTWGFSVKSQSWINRPLQYASNVWTALIRQGEPGKPGLNLPFDPKSLPDLATVALTAEKLKNDWIWLLLAAVMTFLLAGKKASASKTMDVGSATILSKK